MKLTDKRIVLALLAAGMTVMGSARAGDLTPPGAPGATMHTLEEIYMQVGEGEPRTPVETGDRRLRTGVTCE